MAFQTRFESCATRLSKKWWWRRRRRWWRRCRN